MNNTIKSKYLERLLSDFELISEIVLNEMNIIKKMFESADKDLSLCDEIAKCEKIIDSMDVKIREEVINAIFLFNPKAMDLRKIISYHDMTIYLERIGDLIYNISKFVKNTDLGNKNFQEFNPLLSKMLKHTEEMLRNSLYAFSYEDNPRAYLAIETDDKVDALFKEINEKMQVYFAGTPLTQEDVSLMMHINSISYNIERIGDNATNIAEAAIYLMEGKDIRHGNK